MPRAGAEYLPRVGHHQDLGNSKVSKGRWNQRQQHPKDKDGTGGCGRSHMRTHIHMCECTHTHTLGCRGAAGCEAGTEEVTLGGWERCQGPEPVASRA